MTRGALSSRWGTFFALRTASLTLLVISHLFLKGAWWTGLVAHVVVEYFIRTARGAIIHRIGACLTSAWAGFTCALAIHGDYHVATLGATVRWDTFVVEKDQRIVAAGAFGSIIHTGFTRRTARTALVYLIQILGKFSIRTRVNASGAVQKFTRNAAQTRWISGAGGTRSDTGIAGSGWVVRESAWGTSALARSIGQIERGLAGGAGGGWSLTGLAVGVASETF